VKKVCVTPFPSVKLCMVPLMSVNEVGFECEGYETGFELAGWEYGLLELGVEKEQY
jgi:hypothetical protein